MNPLVILSSFTAHCGDLIFDAAFGFRDWLKLNDFSGTRRRKRSLSEAPGSFRNDHIPVVLGADQHATLYYDERGFYLKNRQTGKTAEASPKTLRRFSRRGMRGLRSQSLKLRSS